ncbi:retrovirus-related pol polyprotein from transposon TNT 1-94 [Tanacetum coccineum]|uniref:Retrovirus-related pol polyprotein from transposon TNT 1-94 n=1 Tax=Tanacetum coccineum TaxID=301880 RepID=A0ABQ4YBU4_9ASTR
MQMVGGNGGNQFRQYVGQNVRNQNGIRNQNRYNAVQNVENQHSNGNVVAVWAEGTGNGNNGNQIRCYNCRGLCYLARNCIVRPRIDVAYLQTQLLIAQKEEAGIQLQAEEFDLMAAVGDLDEFKEVNANCILMANLQQASTSGTQTDKALIYDSDGSAEYTEILDPIPEPHQVQQNDSNVIFAVFSVEQSGGTVEQHPATAEETRTLYDSLYNNIAIKVETETTKFVRDFKSLSNEADESLAKHKALEFEIERLLRAVVSQDIISIVQNPTIVETSDLQTELERTKERFENYTLDPLSQKLENENVELEFHILNYAKENAHLKTTYKNLFDSINVSVQKDITKGYSQGWNALSNPVTSNSAPSTQESKVMKNDNVIALGMFRINTSKTSRVDNVMPKKTIKASIRTNPITISQSHVISQENMNPNLNGISSTGLDSTAKIRRPQPRSNTKNDMVPSASKSSCIKNKEVEVEEHHRNLLFSKNKKHMSSECNNVKLAILNDKSEVVCATFKKPKKVGSKERLASPKPRKPRTYLRWLPTRRMFDLKGKIIASSESECQSECSKGHPDLFMVRQLEVLKAYDRKSKASNKLCLEVLKNYLEVAFKRNTCFVRNLKGADLLKGNRTTNLYTVNLHEMISTSLIFLMTSATSTKSWLWHQRLSYLNFDTINDLAKNDLVIGLPKFKYHKEHLVPHVYFLRSKDEAPEVIKTFLKKIQVLLQALVIINDREDIGKLRAKGDISFFIGYYANSCAYKFKTRASKHDFWTNQFRTRSYLYSVNNNNSKQTERELDLLFKAMYDDYISGQPLAAPRTAPATLAPQILQTPTTSTTTADTAPTPINSSS